MIKNTEFILTLRDRFVQVLQMKERIHAIYILAKERGTTIHKRYIHRAIYDVIVGEIWTKKVAFPFVDNATMEQLQSCIMVCDDIVKDINLLDQYIVKSESYRIKRYYI